MRRLLGSLLVIVCLVLALCGIPGADFGTLWMAPFAAFRLGTTMRNNACNGIVDTIDQGSGAGKIKIYTSTQPGSVGGTYGTLLGTLTCSDPAFGNSSTGTATASSITSDTSADASGSAGTFTMTDSDDNVLADGTCGQGSGDLSFDNSTIVAGGVIAISSFSVTVPIS